MQTPRPTPGVPGAAMAQTATKPQPVARSPYMAHMIAAHDAFHAKQGGAPSVTAKGGRPTAPQRPAGGRIRPFG